MTPEALILDFGMGNLRSVARALERAGAKPRVSESPEEVAKAARVVFPGVGACGDALPTLRARGLDQALRDRIAAGLPTLAICVGMQSLFESSDEGRLERGVGLFPGRVARFPDSIELAVPHMGWNLVRTSRPHPVLRDGYFYFLHGYRAEGVPDAFLLATTEYGEVFPAAVGWSSCVAVQFHPEKSQFEGLGLLERFLAWTP